MVAMNMAEAAEMTLKIITKRIYMFPEFTLTFSQYKLSLSKSCLHWSVFQYGY